jgi:hypothetical protein
MLYFQTKNSNLGKNWGTCSNGRGWYILWPFGLFNGIIYGQILYICCLIGIFFPFWLVLPGKIWQPCHRRLFGCIRFARECKFENSSARFKALQDVAIEPTPPPPHARTAALSFFCKAAFYLVTLCVWFETSLAGIHSKEISFIQPAISKTINLIGPLNWFRGQLCYKSFCSIIHYVDSDGATRVHT